MVKGKIYFIHVRARDKDSSGYWKCAAKGGMTFAWSLEEDGIYIGAPAVCYHEDLFVKKEGRRVAEEKFTKETKLAFIPIADLKVRSDIEKENIGLFSIYGNANQELFKSVFEKLLLEHDFTEYMSTGWFESVVRDYLYESKTLDTRKYIF